MIATKTFNPLGKYPEAIKSPVAYAFDIARQAWLAILLQ
jgi:APA family basic amino acid/polyamine antiporter